jgi:hypothetical protein
MFAVGMLVGVVVALPLGALIGVLVGHPAPTERGRADISAALRRSGGGGSK